jgi:hypothetical protein
MDHAAYSRRFLLLLLAGFVILTAFNLNGSSVGMWSAILSEEKTVESLLYSLPRDARSDEWLVWTPSLLAQAKHHPSFPVENPALGAARSPLLMNLPARDYSMFFRPQLWGYFLFDVEHGYAWNWNAKIFGLLAAMFVLIRKLSDGRFWPALVGTAWVFCSSYTQWWFSSLPMLPEMLASWAFALWCVMKLGDGPSRKSAIAITAGLIVATVNFSLCMYPPYQVPLIYLGAAILLGWFWRRRAEIQPDGRLLPEPRWLAFAAAGVALALLPFFVQMLPTLRLAAHTVYPGAQRATGGALGADLFLGLAEPFISARAYPEHRGNVCAAANFLPIWIAAACWMAATVGKGGNPRRQVLWPLLACILAFVVFALCPLPPIVGRLTLLSFSTEDDMILPIGVGGILLSILALREMEADNRHPLRRAILILVCGGIAMNLLIAASGDSPAFFTGWRLALAIAFSWCIFALYLWPMKRLFPTLLLIALLPPATRVNPVNRGLAPLTKSSALPTLEKLRQIDPKARWVGFNNTHQSAFLMAAGVDVISGPKTVPDLDFFRELDPTGRDLNIYNRFALDVFQIAQKPDDVAFTLINSGACTVSIHPANAALEKRNVNFFVFPAPLGNPAAFDLQPFVRIPDRHIWIYIFKRPKPDGAESSTAHPLK